MDNATRHNLRLIRNELEGLDEFVLSLRGSEPVIPSHRDRLYVEVTMGDILEQLDTLIERTPFSYREPVEASDYVCCS
jgi:hypothetical protein